MTTQPSPPQPAAPDADTSVECPSAATLTGCGASTCEDRMAATLAHLADMDALTRRDIAAWDALRGAR